MDNSAFLKQMQSDFDDSLDDIDEDLQTANGDPVVESIETVSTDSDTEIADVDDLEIQLLLIFQHHLISVWMILQKLIK